MNGFFIHEGEKHAGVVTSICKSVCPTKMSSLTFVNIHLLLANYSYYRNISYNSVTTKVLIVGITVYNMNAKRVVI